MDPVSILSIASAASSLVLKCGKIVQTLFILAEQYKQAEVAILSVISNCQTIELAWSRIEKWAANNLDGIDDHEELAQRIALSIYAGQLCMTELEKDLVSLDASSSHSTLRRRTTKLWRDSTLAEHQNRIQSQVIALTLLLEVIKLPSKSEQVELLSIKAPVFRSVEESVLSIVPTALSIRSETADSVQSLESKELNYNPLSFENDLFTSHVYKRNFRVTRVPIKQIRRKPVPGHAKDVILTALGQTTNLPQSAEFFQGSQELISENTLAVTPRQSFDTALHLEQNKEMTSNGEERDVQECIGIITTACYGELHRGQSSSLNNTQVVDPNLILMNEPSHLEVVTVELDITAARPAALGIENESFMYPSTAFGPPVGLLHRSFSITSSSICHLEEITGGGSVASVISPSTTNLDMFSLILPDDGSLASRQVHIEAVSSLVCLPLCNLTSPTTTAMLESFYEYDRVQFITLMQLMGLTRGTKFLNELAAALESTQDRVTELDDSSQPSEQNMLKKSWKKIILKNDGVADAARYRDLINTTEIWSLLPTALQLACASARAIVVEYILSLDQLFIHLNWQLHPFILATKRRSKKILEIFFKSARHTVSQCILNSALTMVVNQDCSLTEHWLDPHQNDNKRIGADVNIVTLLLSNGASVNATDHNGISVLSLAIRAAYSLNPFSLQIVDILLRRGARFGPQEQDLIADGPPDAFRHLLEKHKPVCQQTPQPICCNTVEEGVFESAYKRAWIPFLES